jgi:DNA-binding NarL/FixJ family response regulator
MPEMSGTKATKKIQKCRPHIRIIGLSMHDDRGTMEMMINAGATACIYKTSPAEELIK